MNVHKINTKKDKNSNFFTGLDLINCIDLINYHFNEIQWTRKSHSQMRK